MLFFLVFRLSFRHAQNMSYGGGDIRKGCKPWIVAISAYAVAGYRRLLGVTAVGTRPQVTQPVHLQMASKCNKKVS